MLTTTPPNCQGIEPYRDYLGPRYATFRAAFDSFIASGGRTIVELGTTRSFVSGNQRGCMVNDRRYWQPDEPGTWDWGAGMFTKMCALHMRDHWQRRDSNPHIHSVDISATAIEISRVITADESDLIAYHHTTSEHFLRTFPETIDLLYMDAGETESDADQLHAREAEIVLARNLIAPRGLVLIDDVHIPGAAASKGRLSIPLFCRHGFQIRASSYQVLLERPSSEPTRSSP